MDDITLRQLVIISWEKTESENRLSGTMKSDDLTRMVKSAVIGNPEGDSEAEKQYQNDTDYGLVPEKPIFVNGFMGSRMYLSMLKTDKGELLRNERRGSMRAEGIEGLVDIYDTFRLNDHSAYGTIYICIYGNSTSDQAPKGYSLGIGGMGYDPATEDFEVLYGPEPMGTTRMRF